MCTRNYYLVKVLNYQGRKVNLCITDNADKAKSICKDFANRSAFYRKISDFKAMDILLQDLGCIKSFY